jgi:hypothetical protein
LGTFLAHSPDEVRALIKKTYGIGPAKTLDQMLYKRASKGTMFYKTAEGRFGLLALRATTEDVRTPTTAAAYRESKRGLVLRPLLLWLLSSWLRWH